MPNTVGQTNGSTDLGSYTATIGGNGLVDAINGGVQITDSDVVTDMRVAKIQNSMGKAGPTVWHDENPFLDTVNGVQILTDMIYMGCYNPDAGTGVCSTAVRVSTGVKRAFECDNAQISSDEGGTSCILDTASTYGLKSTKLKDSSGSGSVPLCGLLAMSPLLGLNFRAAAARLDDVPWCAWGAACAT